MAKKSFSIKELEYIQCQCKTIARLESHVSEKEVRRMLYSMAVFIYRNFHDAGIPADIAHPRLDAPKKVWSSVLMDFADERKVKQLEQEFKVEERQLVAA